MQPTSKEVHIDAAMTNVSIMHKPQQFVADRIFPKIRVAKSSDYYFTFLKGAFYRNQAGRRGPGTNAPRSGYMIARDRYSCFEVALAHPVPVETIRRADNPLRPMETGTRMATNAVLLRKDVDLASTIINTAAWSTSSDVGGDWASGAAANSFYGDILDGKAAIRTLIGATPNVLVMDPKTLRNLKESQSLLDKIKYTGTQARPADVTPAMLAALLELEEVIVAESITSTAEEKADGTDFTAFCPWEVNAGKGTALLYYRPPAGEGAIDVPSAGYTFNEILGADALPDVLVESDADRIVRKWWESSPKQWVIEAAESYDQKITCPDAGILFYDTVAD